MTHSVIFPAVETRISRKVGPKATETGKTNVLDLVELVNDSFYLVFGIRGWR